MKLQGRIPVEPLDDERLTNIERKLVVGVSELQAPPERASRFTLAFAGAAMAVAVAGFVGWKLHTPAASPTVAKTDETFKITSRADSDVAVTRSPGKTEIALARGNVDLDVKHDPSRLLVIHAGDTDIEDVGTKFSVEYDGKNHVVVRVLEGEVKVARGGKDFAVTASNGWTTETGTITLAQIDSAHIDVASADSSPSVNGANVNGTVGAGPNGASTANGIDGRNGADARIDGRNASVPDGRGSDARGSDTRGSDARTDGHGSDARGSAAGQHKAGETNIKKAILAVKLNPLPGTISEMIEQLKAKGDGEDKSRLLYSIAVKQHEAKNDAGALHTIEGTVNGRTKDEAYQDAMWLQVRITCTQGLDDKCRLAAQRYLNNIPYGPQAGVVQEILKAIAL